MQQSEMGEVRQELGPKEMTSIINRVIVCERVHGKTRWDEHMNEWRGWLEEESKEEKKLHC